MIKALSVFFWCVISCFKDHASRIIFQGNLFYTNIYFFQTVDHSRSFMAVLPAGMRGSDKDTPLLSVLGQLLNVPQSVMEGLEHLFYSSTLGFSWVAIVSAFPLLPGSLESYHRIITSFFSMLIFRPTCCASVLRRVVFSCMCWRVRKTIATSSAKSRSSRVEKMVPLKPRGRWMRCCLPHHPFNRQVQEKRRHPCLTQVFIPKLDSLFLICSRSCCRRSCWQRRSVLEFHMPWVCAIDFLGGCCRKPSQNPRSWCTTASAIQCTVRWCCA